MDLCESHRRPPRVTLQPLALLDRATLDLPRSPLQTGPVALAIDEHPAVPQDVREQKRGFASLLERHELNTPSARGLEPIDQLRTRTVVVAAKTNEHVEVAPRSLATASDTAEQDREPHVRLRSERLHERSQKRPVRPQIHPLFDRNEDLPLARPPDPERSSLGRATERAPAHSNLSGQPVELCHPSNVSGACVQYRSA